ncbi:MAG: DUF3604 domain-containing protein [Ignavibacteria bacterium]|nr:DUF3604 domain-containing protein [Ignavibacteria bacterium]
MGPLENRFSPGRSKLLLIVFYYSLTTILYSQTMDNEARMQILPKEAVAGSFQKIQLAFTVGGSGMNAGGGMRFEIPVAYLETKPYFWSTPQTRSSQSAGYVSASASNGAGVSINIYGPRDGIIECVLQDKHLPPGGRIFIEYSGNVQSICWKLSIRTQWRASAKDPWLRTKEYPEIKILPEPASVMLVVTPADLKVDEAFEMALVLMDRYGNRAIGYLGTLKFKSSDSAAAIPESYSFVQADSGVHVFKGLRYRTTGFQRIDVTDGELKGRYNYTEVSSVAPRYRRYFGDTHFHTGTGIGSREFALRDLGGDHRGQFISEEEAYEYVRDVMRLDFASASEHDAARFTDSGWTESQQISDSFVNPGKFTTFYAYEWTPVPQEGHHVIMYKEKESKVFNRFDYPTKTDLWNAFDRQNKPTLMIPHSMWAQPDHRIWDHVNNKYRKIGEIYSLWNTRFLLKPNDDLQRFELGIDNPWSYQYAWAHGHRIGVIGSSDNHTGRPGLNNFTFYTEHTAGLAAAIAEGNNRDDLWDAFQHRRTYATTGTRILLDFTSDNHLMGDEYHTKEPTHLKVRVAGTNILEKVEIVRGDTTGYRVICSKAPGRETVSFDYIDKDFSGDCVYYVRVKQVNEFGGGAWAYPTGEMAWSSPIWVNYKDN